MVPADYVSDTTSNLRARLKTLLGLKTAGHRNSLEEDSHVLDDRTECKKLRSISQSFPKIDGSSVELFYRTVEQ